MNNRIPNRYSVIVGISVFTRGMKPRNQIPTKASNIEESSCSFDFFPIHIVYARATKQSELTIKAEIYGCSPSNLSGA